MISRRSFVLASCSGGLMAQNSGAQLLVGSQTNAWPIDPADFPQFLQVLGKLASLGFNGFETSYRNLTRQFAQPASARQKIHDTGLRFLGIHIFLAEYDPSTRIAPWDLVKDVADGGAALGAQHLILSGHSVSTDGKSDPEALRRKVEALKRVGEYCAGKGLILAYHNHSGEFQRQAEEIGRILDSLDPKYFRLILDIGHVTRAGVDAIKFFERRHNNINGIHLRDLRGEEQVPLGQGDFNLAALAEVIRKLNWKGWLIVEEERPGGGRPGDAAVIPARRHIQQVFGV